MHLLIDSFVPKIEKNPGENSRGFPLKIALALL